MDIIRQKYKTNDKDVVKVHHMSRDGIVGRTSPKDAVNEFMTDVIIQLGD